MMRWYLRRMSRADLIGASAEAAASKAAGQAGWRANCCAPPGAVVPSCQPSPPPAPPLKPGLQDVAGEPLLRLPLQVAGQAQCACARGVRLHPRPQRSGGRRTCQQHRQARHQQPPRHAAQCARPGCCDLQQPARGSTLCRDGHRLPTLAAARRQCCRTPLASRSTAAASSAIPCAQAEGLPARGGCGALTVRFACKQLQGCRRCQCAIRVPRAQQGCPPCTAPSSDATVRPQAARQQGGTPAGRRQLASIGRSDRQPYLKDRRTGSGSHTEQRLRLGRRCGRRPRRNGAPRPPKGAPVA